MNELELEEKIERQMTEKGYVLLFSELFEDFVAFYKDPAVLSKIPLPMPSIPEEKYIPYSDEELRALFGEGRKPSVARLKYVHNVKKVFGTIEVVDDGFQTLMI